MPRASSARSNASSSHGASAIIHAETSINPQDYGMTPMLGDSIGLVIDAEFERKS